MKRFIETIGLKKSFGDKQVLKGINIVIPEGQVFVLLGESGCGKSVFIKHLIGLFSPDDGEIYFHEDPIHNLSEEEWLVTRRKMAYIFQQGALFDSMNVYDNVAFPLRQRDFSEEDIETLVKDRLYKVGLNNIENMRISSLSGGMRKRVALARSLVLSPEAVFYDEPTTGLDPVMTAQIGELILEMHRDLNLTSIIVTHDISLALSIADKLVLFYDGRVHASGSVEEFKNSEDPFIRQFLEGRAKGPIDPLRIRS